MTHIRAFTMRGLVLALALSTSGVCLAQSAPAASAAPPASEKADAAAAKQKQEEPKQEEQKREERKQLDAALARADEFLAAGKWDDAIKLLKDVDRKIPGSALVATSIGTAFELKGELLEALNWIREGIQRDAGEHGASEWLHARILDARVSLAKDAAWFDKNRVLGLDFGAGDVPVAPEILPIEQGRIKGADQLLRQIDVQLAERMKFSKPPDPVIGDLFASAGDFAIASAVSPLDDRKSRYRPEQYYERALEYGAPHSELIRRRLAKYRADLAALPPAPKEEVADYPLVSERLEKASQPARGSKIYIAAGVGGVAALIVVGFLLDRRRRRLAAQNPPPPLPDVD